MTEQPRPAADWDAIVKKRKAGSKGNPRIVVTPEVLSEIGRKWLQGRATVAIAKEVGVSESTIRYHIQTHLKPQWHEEMRSTLDIDLAKVSLIEKIAWERFYSAAPGETAEQIEKALTEDKRGRCRLRIVKQAVKSITRTGDAAWLQIIQWCLDFRAKIHAHYAPTRTHVDIGGEMRVAGLGPSEVDQVMLQRLMEQIAERRKHQAALSESRKAVGDVGPAEISESRNGNGRQKPGSNGSRDCKPNE
jgi:hypothetical protein